MPYTVNTSIPDLDAFACRVLVAVSTTCCCTGFCLVTRRHHLNEDLRVLSKPHFKEGKQVLRHCREGVLPTCAFCDSAFFLNSNPPVGTMHAVTMQSVCQA